MPCPISPDFDFLDATLNLERLPVDELAAMQLGQGKQLFRLCAWRRCCGRTSVLELPSPDQRLRLAERFLEGAALRQRFLEVGAAEVGEVVVVGASE